VASLGDTAVHLEPAALEMLLRLPVVRLAAAGVGAHAVARRARLGVTADGVQDRQGLLVQCARLGVAYLVAIQAADAVRLVVLPPDAVPDGALVGAPHLLDGRPGFGPGGVGRMAIELERRLRPFTVSVDEAPKNVLPAFPEKSGDAVEQDREGGRLARAVGR